jgi:hypothetical protein
MAIAIPGEVIIPVKQFIKTSKPVLMQDEPEAIQAARLPTRASIFGRPTIVMSTLVSRIHLVN